MTYSSVLFTAAIRSKARRVVALAVILSVGCDAPPSSTDREKLALLQRVHGQRFAFNFEGDLYVRAVSRDTVAPSQAEMQGVYRTFMFDESHVRRRPTTFVYLNVYNARGDFLYQIAYDPKVNQFVTSKTEHY